MSKITIEDVINKNYSGDQLKNALDLATHIRKLNLPLKEYDTEEKNYQYSIEYKGEKLCFISIYTTGKKDFRVYSYEPTSCSWIYCSDVKDSIERIEPAVEEDIKQAVWKKVRKCIKSCAGKCGPGKRKNILGKEFENVCGSALWFCPPINKDWECIKQMITAMKNDIDNMAHTEVGKA